MANDKSFKIKNGLSAGRYLGSNGTETAGANGPYGVFDTTLYTGTGVEQTITNNIDLAGDGGLVWIKDRTGTGYNALFDTERGFATDLGYPSYYRLESNANGAQIRLGYGFQSMNSDGFTIGYDNGSGTNACDNNLGLNGNDFVSWTFKKQAKFFDIVTYTGDGTNNRNITHSLNNTPGFIIVKTTSHGGDWVCWHRSLGTDGIILNSANAKSGYTAVVNYLSQSTSSNLIVGTNDLNQSGRTYVAYLFAHDTASDSFIKCGGYTGDGSDTNREIDIGFKPSWLMVKSASSAYNWIIIDSTRGEGEDPPTANVLTANLSNAEDPAGDRLFFSDSGFTLSTSSFDYNKSGDDFIYMAIRGIVPTKTLDLSTGHTFSFTPSEATDILFSNPPASGSATGFSVEINNTGGYALTWPSSVKWHLGTAPTATASKELYTFVTTDGGTTYYGKLAGSDIA